VRTLLDTIAPPGGTTVAWDGTDARGERVAGGVHFVRAEAAGRVSTERVVRLR
jgi:hypothetical protein